jgi:phage host-nuclease inhibitor protein Gam
MARKTAIKGATRAPEFPVPQTGAEAEAAIAAIGADRRELAQIEAELSERVTHLREHFGMRARPVQERLKARIAGVQSWAEANRDELTRAGRTKTVKMNTGEIMWRLRPPSVRLRAKDAVLEACRALGLGRFIRVTEEVSKEAMLAEPEVAAQIAGVTIASAGEDFVIKPHESQIEEVA